MSYLFFDRFLDRELDGLDAGFFLETTRQRPMKIRIPKTAIPGMSPYAISGRISSMSQ